MVSSQFGTNAPNGNVGVYGWLRNADMRLYTPGVVDGFIPQFNGLMVAPARSPYNVCLAANANGDRDILALNGVDLNARINLSAPPTPGQARCYAIVVYKLPADSATTNNGIGTVQMAAVAGPDSVAGSEVPPSDTTIRQAISGGSTAYLAVVMTITVLYGTTSLTAAANLNTTIQRLNVRVNNQTIPGFQCNANPTNRPFIVDSLETRQDNAWSYTRWSDGKYECFTVFNPRTNIDFITIGSWKVAGIDMPVPYPFPFATWSSSSPTDGKQYLASFQSAKIIFADNGYNGPVFVSNATNTKFGRINLMDPNGGTVGHPNYACFATGYWY